MPCVLGAGRPVHGAGAAHGVVRCPPLGGQLVSPWWAWVGCFAHPPAVERVEVKLVCGAGAKEAVANHIPTHFLGREPFPGVGVSYIPASNEVWEGRAVPVSSVDCP